MITFYIDYLTGTLYQTKYKARQSGQKTSRIDLPSGLLLKIADKQTFLNLEKRAWSYPTTSSSCKLIKQELVWTYVFWDIPIPKKLWKTVYSHYMLSKLEK